MPKPHKNKKHATRTRAPQPPLSASAAPSPGTPPSAPDPDAPPPPLPPPPRDQATFAAPPADSASLAASDLPPLSPGPLGASTLASAEPAAAEERFVSEIMANIRSAIQESRDDYLRLTIALDQLSQQQALFEAKLAELETRLNNLRNL